MKEWEKIAKHLWKIIDDIDTASDIYKPEIKGYEKYIFKKVGERFDYIKSDGYNLERVEDE